MVLRPGRDITLVSYGSMMNELLLAAQLLEAQGISPEIIKLNRITPLDPGLVLSSVRRTGALLVAEDCVETGSVVQGKSEGSDHVWQCLCRRPERR